MPADKRSLPISPARLVFLSALVILVALVVWVAVRAVGPSSAAGRPIVVLPSVPSWSESYTDTPSATPSVSPSVGRSPSARPVTSSPSPRRSSAPSASPSPRRSPTPATRFTAALTVTASWDGGYIAMVRVVNSGPKPASWSVAVTHAGLAGLVLGGTWNAQGHQAASSFLFAGGPLGPGQSVAFGYQAGKQGPGPARPSGCSVDGGGCHVN